jgi:hypothetical protein
LLEIRATLIQTEQAGTTGPSPAEMTAGFEVYISSLAIAAFAPVGAIFFRQSVNKLQVH